MTENPRDAILAEFHVENLLPARHDAAMTPVFFRRCGLVVAMIALLGGAVLLWPGGSVMLADLLSPDGSAGEATAARMKTGGLCAAAAVLMAGVAVAASARAASAATRILGSEAAEARSHLAGALRQPSYRRELTVLAAIMLLGAAARLAWISSPIRLDEAISFMNFSRLGVMYSATHYHTNSHTLNSLLMVVSTLLFGESETALRLPSLLCGLAVIPLLHGFVRPVAGAPAALLAAALVAAAPGLVEFGFLARGYSILIMFFLLLLLAVRRLAVRGGAWATLGVALLPAMMMYTMLSALYPVAVTATWGICRAWRERDARAAGMVFAAFAVSAAITTLLFAPMLLVSGLAAITGNYYVQPQPLPQVLHLLPYSLASTWLGWWRGLPEWLPLLTIPLFVAGLWRVRDRFPLWPVVTILPLLLLLQRVVPYPRTWLFLLPLYLATAATGAIWLSAKAWPDRKCSAWMALLVAGAGAIWSPMNEAIKTSLECSGWPDDRAVASEMHAAGLGASDRVVSNSVVGRLHYYFRRLGLPPDALDLTPDEKTERIFRVEIPIGVEWRIQSALGNITPRLTPWRTVAEFPHGTRLSVATLRRDSSPSDPAQSPAAPAP